MPIKNGRLDNDLNANTNGIMNLRDPVSDQDAATKAYVDSHGGGGGGISQGTLNTTSNNIIQTNIVWLQRSNTAYQAQFAASNTTFRAAFDAAGAAATVQTFASGASNNLTGVITNRTLLHSNNTAQVSVATNNNIISGSTSNLIAPGFFDSIIAGGGNSGEGAGLTSGSNYIGSSSATISGGAGNVIKGSSDGSTIAGGARNIITNGNDESLESVISGGAANYAEGNHVTISGGNGNAIYDVDNSTISGGGANYITNSDPGNIFPASATISGGGANSIIDSLFGIIAGGHNNSIAADGAGAYGNLITNSTPYAQMMGYREKAMTVLSNGNVTVVGTFSAGGLNASQLSSGTVPPARLGTGSGGSSKFLREDSTFQTIPGGGDLLAANNLSDVSSASLALANLGGAPSNNASMRTLGVTNTLSVTNGRVWDLWFANGQHLRTNTIAPFDWEFHDTNGVITWGTNTVTRKSFDIDGNFNLPTSNGGIIQAKAGQFNQSLLVANGAFSVQQTGVEVNTFMAGAAGHTNIILVLPDGTKQTNDLATFVIGLAPAAILTNQVQETNVLVDTSTLSPTSNATNYTVPLLPGPGPGLLTIYGAATNANITLTGTNNADWGRTVFINNYTSSVNCNLTYTFTGATNQSYTAVVSNGWAAYYNFHTPDATGTNVSIFNSPMLHH